MMNGDHSGSKPQCDAQHKQGSESGANNISNNNISRNLQKNQVSFRLPPEGSHGSFRGNYLDQMSLPVNLSEEDRSHGSRRAVRRFSPPESGDNLPNNNANSSPNSSPRSSYRKHRRTESFRAFERKGVRGQAGGKRARFKAYLEERTANLFSGRKNRENFPNVADQYHIPPPEEVEDCSVFVALGQLYTGAFDDLSMWLYGASFWKILLFDWILYMIFVIVFVFLIYCVDRINLNNPDKSEGGCIYHGRDEGVLPLWVQLEFAFELSWTTFATVGYGTIAPPGDDVGCYNLRFVCSLEAILGVAYVSMCSGLFYARLTRLLGEAPVTFSSTLCVQYGKGLVDAGNRYKPLTDESYESYVQQKSEHLAKSDEGKVFTPFPVLEFRVVNNRANSTSVQNEIFDAECTAIVQISLGNDPNFVVDENDEAMPSRWTSSTTSRTSTTTDKKNQKVYYTLPLKPSYHPYFSRVWILQHTLDSNSPLLRREVRKSLCGRESGWDPSLNRHQDIRASLVEFNSIRVILNGGSSLCKSDVYAEKVYSYHDVCVGWQYVGVCYDVDEKNQGAVGPSCDLLGCRKRSGAGVDRNTRVDFSLIHDIVPQRGGDFEPLESDDNLLQASLRRSSNYQQ